MSVFLVLIDNNVLNKFSNPPISKIRFEDAVRLIEIVYIGITVSPLVLLRVKG